MLNIDEVLSDEGLVFTHPSEGGISRKGKPGKFVYVDDNGKEITNDNVLKRIHKLVLPPAWKDVWISKSAKGYLQAVGVDLMGRKQYKYHTDWVSRRSDTKYFRLLDFGKALPKARKQVAKDLKRKKWDERKVLAVCVEVLQETMIRVGNATYEKTYKSFGLSTLKDRHFKETKVGAQLNFVGKKGVKQEVRLTNKRLVRLIKKSKDIPGQDLFQYFEADGTRRKITSTAINNYIKEITGDSFTAKDFRTWGGTLEALRQLANCTRDVSSFDKKKVILTTLDCVAGKLGNTRAVCKSSYVYPMLLEAFEDGTLKKFIKQMPDENIPDALKKEEAVLLKFLKIIKKASLS